MVSEEVPHVQVVVKDRSRLGIGDVLPHRAEHMAGCSRGGRVEDELLAEVGPFVVDRSEVSVPGREFTAGDAGRGCDPAKSCNGRGMQTSHLAASLSNRVVVGVRLSAVSPSKHQVRPAESTTNEIGGDDFRRKNPVVIRPVARPDFRRQDGAVGNLQRVDAAVSGIEPSVLTTHCTDERLEEHHWCSEGPRHHSDHQRIIDAIWKL